MIQASASLDPPIPRLLARLEDDARSRTVVLGSGCAPRDLQSSLANTPDARVLMISALGAHPDARAPRLKALWDLEELARAMGRPTLTLRLAPLVGPLSPLWLRLRSRPVLSESGETLLNPVAESDVVETLSRALDGRAAWEGWYEVAGEEALTLQELADLAMRTPRLARDAGSWEPPIAELREHRLTESEPWSEHFGLAPSRVSRDAATWS